MRLGTASGPCHGLVALPTRDPAGSRMEQTPGHGRGVDRVGMGRTLGVLAACAAFLLAAAGAGLVLFHSVQGAPGSTWNDYRETSRGLSVDFAAEGCARLARADVDERDERVLVTLVLERDLPWYGYCSTHSTLKRVRVQLDRPLGDRQVVDGSCLREKRERRACLREARAGDRAPGVAMVTASTG